MTSRRLAVGGWRLAVIWAFAFSALGQVDAPVRPLPLGDVLLSLPSPHIAPAGQWEIKFTHRFNQSLTEGSFSDQLHSLFGLDTNADVVFGGTYAQSANLQYSLARSNVNDTLEAAAKYVVLRQLEGNRPFSMTLRGGADIRTERDLEDRTSFFAQAILSRQFGRKAEVFLLPTVVSNAGRTIDGESSVAMFDYAFNVPVALAWTVRPGLLAVAEVIPPNGDLPEGIDSDIGWSLGIKRNIGGHWFEILLTNNQSTMVDQYVTTTFQGSGLDADQIRLGFNIERRFGRRK